MKESDLIKIGFIKTKSFNHDEFHSDVFTKGSIIIYRTKSNIKGMELSIDIEIEELPELNLSIEELKTLDKIINKK